MANWVPDTILRAKGFVYLSAQPAQRFLLQLVGKRWELTPAGEWPDGVPATRLVFIGLPGSLTDERISAALLPQDVVHEGIAYEQRRSN